VRESANRDERKRGFDAFYAKWKEYERTFGVTYYSDAKEDSVYARIRKYPDSFARSMDGNNLPLAVYDALVKSANDNLPTLHRYFKLRGRMLGVTEMRYYDVYPPLVSGGREFPIDEGVKIMLESAKPWRRLRSRDEEGPCGQWMDVYPRPRKQSGRTWPAPRRRDPYLLINYTNNYNSVSTVAHEWGHAMHSPSNRAQPFPTRAPRSLPRSPRPPTRRSCSSTCSRTLPTTTSACSTSAAHWRRYAAPSSGRSCSPSSSVRCMRAWTRASR
jgi:oligoendopeptidase F